jgi:hypothetical protein
VNSSGSSRNRINELLGERVEPLARYLYPNGKKAGHSWRVGSLDINIEKRIWGDWDGSTPKMSQSLIDLWMYATGSDFKTAIREIEKWLRIKSEWQAPPPVFVAKQPKPFVLPQLERPTMEDLEVISHQRAIPVQALSLAAERGFLWTYDDQFGEGRAWLLTDSARKSAVSRRVDGQAWRAVWANGAKSKTLKGSMGSWPIGIKEAAGYPAIGLVEGAPDFLALIAHALQRGVLSQIAPVCMAGAQMSIPEETLPLFVGKRIRIFVHADEAGMDAATRWYSVLRNLSTVDCYSFDGLEQIDGSPVGDLNDLLRIDLESREKYRKEVDELLGFIYLAPERPF